LEGIYAPQTQNSSDKSGNIFMRKYSYNLLVYYPTWLSKKKPSGELTKAPNFKNLPLRVSYRYPLE
jgi:hypothetical protein